MCAAASCASVKPVDRIAGAPPQLCVAGGNSRDQTRPRIDMFRFTYMDSSRETGEKRRGWSKRSQVTSRGRPRTGDRDHAARSRRDFGAWHHLRATFGSGTEVQAAIASTRHDDVVVSSNGARSGPALAMSSTRYSSPPVVPRDARRRPESKPHTHAPRSHRI